MFVRLEIFNKQLKLKEQILVKINSISEKMLFNKPSNTTTGFLLQTMLYVANITQNDLKPRTHDEFLLTPIGADSGS